MTTVWVLGAGKFGHRAVQKLQSLSSETQIVLVDQDPCALAICEGEGVETRTADVIEYLTRHLRLSEKPDWIVPAVPLHVAFEWIVSVLPDDAMVKKLAIPERLINELPCTPGAGKGKLFISLADFICPDDCCEPAGHCTVTGAPRPYDLFRKLARLQIENFIPVVVRSRQLAPGLGGYRPKDLFNALDQVKTAGTSILLSTACRCHGVLDAFALVK